MKARIVNTPYEVDVEPFYLAVKNYDAAGMHPAHYNRFIGFIDADKNVYERTDLEFLPEPAEFEENPNAQKKLIDQRLSVRTFNCVGSAFEFWTDGAMVPADITLGDVAKHTRREYLHVRNLGKKSLNEIEVLLDLNGLKFAE